MTADAYVAAYIALGANLGDPPAQLRAALRYLVQTRAVQLGPVSSFYRSTPLGPAGQPDYCNAVCALDTTLTPGALLGLLQEIEDAAGRQRSERWGARKLDLDLLWMDGLQLATSHLELPHPRLHERAFVLVPLAELAPDLMIPQYGRVGELADAIDRSGLSAWE